MDNLRQRQFGLSFVVPALLLAFIIGLSVRFVVSSRNSIDTDSSIETNIGITKPINDAKFAPFWQAWNILDSKYVGAASSTVDNKLYGAIKGLTSAYGDPYTVFFPPAESKMFQEDISGNFSGVGMEIGIKNSFLTVVTPIKGSPADKAGVKSGDIIMTINGTSTSDLSVDQAVSYIRGPKGTSVKILFLPKNANKPIEKTIVRDIIQVPTLETDEKAGGVFVIKLYSFTAQSPYLFRDALRKLITSGYHKVIVDLRGNPGGYLEAAVDIASWFLPSNSLVVTEDFGPKRDPVVFRSKYGSNIFGPDFKLILLVDGGSASASEILAGALQENGVAKLVGTKTFGKGSVQELIDLTPNTSLKITIARWLTPKGHNLSHDGLEPDYVVPVTDKDTTAGQDPQMNKALELMAQ